MIAATATFALNAGLWFRRGRLPMVFSSLAASCCCCAENPLIPAVQISAAISLATHTLKRTGSYEQAIYAIQDTPDMVAQHYGRFLPQDKSEIAARILNQLWEAA
ncbi:MAG: hypothetical protein ACT4OK_22680 [Gemmobacter sp.]